MTPRCTICFHPQREGIDKAIVDGWVERAIAEKFSVARSTLQRHRPHIATMVARSAWAKTKTLEAMAEQCEKDLDLVLDTHRARVRDRGSAMVVVKATAQRQKTMQLLFGSKVKIETTTPEVWAKLSLEEKRERLTEARARLEALEAEVAAEEARRLSA